MTIVALLAAAALAQDMPGQETPDFDAELKALEEGFKKAQQEFQAAYRAAKTRDEQTQILKEKNPTEPYLAKFQDLAKRAEGHEAAASALAWVFRLAGQLAKQDVAREAAQKLLASHPKSAHLAAVAQGLRYGGRRGGGWAKDWLRTAVEKAAAPEAKAAALFSLGCILMEEPGATDEQKAEGRKAIERLLKEHPDSPLAKRAEGQIFELEHLQIGQSAPDFEATDADGKTFKLSDYRGKVVVIDFWGFW